MKGAGMQILRSDDNSARYDRQITGEVTTPAGERMRVILVEDDEYFRDAIQTDLVEEGFSVHCFTDGPSMLAAIADGLVADAIVLDWGLEKVLGIDLIAQIRSRGIPWPIVFLTARNSPIHERLALRGGAADFIDKARGSTILGDRLHLAMTRPSAPSSHPTEVVFHCGKLRLRPAIARAYWDEIDVGLTVTEFKIVRLLAANVGSYITHRRIYDCMHQPGFVAGMGEEGYRTNVRSAVKRIRNKFKEICPEFDSIQTYTSFGYCWGKPLA